MKRYTKKYCIKYNKIGYIYALYYKGKPFYIGQTRRTIQQRFNDHYELCFYKKAKSNLPERCLYIYSFIKRVTNSIYFFNDISYKELKTCYVSELDKEELKYIKYCIDKEIIIFNNCNKTNKYIQEKFNYKVLENIILISIIKINQYKEKTYTCGASHSIG